MFFSKLLLAQFHSSCDGQRYREDVFQNVSLATAVKYGENTTIGGSFQELYMDIYVPAGDTETDRPAIVFAFGGAFIVGTREDMDGVCKAFARKGYVAATIDYRLLDLSNADSLQMSDVVVKASNDMRAAIRFLREDALNDNQYGINPDLIFSGGVSAGAVTAAQAAYFDEGDELPESFEDIITANGGIEGNSSTNTSISSAVSGVINLSGAVKDADFIDEDDPALFSVHDNGDVVVPFNMGASSLFPQGGVLEGSNLMHQQAEEVGLLNELIVVNSSSHVSYFLSSTGTVNFNTVMEDGASFIYDIVCEGFTSLDEQAIQPNVRVFPNPATTDLFVQVPEEAANLSVEVYDITGRLVLKEQRRNSTDHQLSIENLEAGSYMLKLVFQDERYAAVHRKVIIH